MASMKGIHAGHTTNRGKVMKTVSKRSMDVKGFISAYTIKLVKEPDFQYQAFQFRTSLDVANFLRVYLEGADREHFVVILVNQQHNVIGVNKVSTGSLTGSTAHPRETFKAAILANASHIVIAHNHPSGYPAPSMEDRAITKRLCEAGKILGIGILDHVILGDNCHYSFADEGALDR